MSSDPDIATNTKTCVSNTSCNTGYYCDKSNHCMINATPYACTQKGGIYSESDSVCSCAPDSIFDMTANACLRGPCQLSLPGYYFTACPGAGSCINNSVCINPNVTSGGWNAVCNEPIAAPGQTINNCMSFFEGAPQGFSSEEYSVADPPPQLLAQIKIGTTTPVTLTSDILLSHILNNGGATDLCTIDPALNVASDGVATGRKCYYNSLQIDGDAALTSTPPLITSVGTTAVTGGANGILEFYSDTDAGALFAGTNIGNFPGQSNLFVMFANAENSEWLTPNHCPFNSDDQYSACYTMGAGMRCEPGTSPIMVSQCTSPHDTVCTTSGWHDMSTFLPCGAALVPSTTGSPTKFSIWGCSADAANVASKTGGTYCPTGFEEGIIYDTGTGTYVGTCVRVPQYVNTPGSSDSDGLAANYCNSSEERVGACQTNPNNWDDSASTAGEGFMCWGTYCYGPNGMVALDNVPYIPLNYGYQNFTGTGTDMTVTYKICSSPDGTTNPTKYGDIYPGCSKDLQKDWYATCGDASTYYGCWHGDGNDAVWLPSTTHTNQL